MEFESSLGGKTCDGRNVGSIISMITILLVGKFSVIGSNVGVFLFVTYRNSALRYFSVAQLSKISSVPGG